MASARRRLWIALGLSVVAHVLAVTGREFPGWLGVAPQEPVVSRFEAHLAPVQKSRPRAIATKPKPAPVAPLQDVVSMPQTTPPEDKPAEPAPVLEIAETAATPVSPPSAAEPAFPRAVRLAFSVRLGVGGVLVGRMHQTWHSDGRRYRIESHTTSAGLVALFKTLKFDQTSEGTLDAQGLRPVSFRTERDGVLTEEVRFDWSQAQLTLKNRDVVKELPLPAGAQDLLSLFYQTALSYRGNETIAVNVATGKRFGPYLLARMGEERIDTALGPISTVRLKRVTEPGEDNIEIWLGRELSWLPVRIRFTERKGEIFDQLLDDADIDGVRPALPAVNGAPNNPDTPLSG